MKRNFTKFFAALALFAFFIPSLTVMGGTKTEGFESATPSSTYNQTVTISANQSDCGIGWTIYYGTVSTQGPIDGQSAQMRWYKSASSNYPYIQSTTAIGNLTNVAFKARVGHTDVKMNVYYSTNGTTWTDLATDEVFSDTYVKNFSYDIPSGGQYIKIGVSSNSTAPNGNYYSLLVDDVVFTYTGEINTYTVTYHANVTGASDIEVEYNEGATVTIADNTFSNPGYAFTEWNTEADGNGDSYAPGDEIEDIDDDLELYAQWEESSTATYTYNFAGANNFYTDAALTTHPSAGSGNSVGTIYYGDGSTFVASGTNRYFSSASSGYFMLGKTGAQISLPTFEGYKITQVIVHTSGSVSTNVQVSIVSGSHTVSAAQKWATNSDFTYYIDADYQTSALSLNVTNNYNSQFTSIQLVCELDVPSTDPTIVASDVDITYDATSGSISYTIENEPTPAGTLTASTTANWLTIGTATTSTVPFTCTENDNVVSRTATVTLTYTYGNNITTKDIIVTQGVDETLGTADNPYTVAQARTFIDGLNGGTSTEKYVSGIISQIDSYNSNYSSITYWISDDGTTTDQLEVYSGKGINGANFNSINDVELTAEVVVKGNLKKYNTTYEFDKNNELVVYNAPQHDVEAPTFSPVAGTYAEAQSVTISCESPSTIYYYTLDGTEPTPNSTLYSEPIPVSSTTTIKAVAYAGGDDHSTVATANYYFCSEGDPYTVTEALSFAEYQYPANGIYVQGVVSTAATSLSNGTLTYYISEDGTTDNQLEVYKGKDLDNEAFTAVDNLQLGDIVTVYGNVQVYNSTIEFGSGNYLVYFYRPVVSNITISPDRIDATAAGADGTLNITYSGLEIGDMTDFEIVYLDIDGDPIDQPNWIEVEVAEQDPQEGEGYVVSYIIDENDGDARTVYFQVFAPSLDDDFVYSNMVTVEQAEYVEPTTYTLASSIVSGKTYIISNGTDRAMGAQSGNIRSAAAVSIDDNNVAYVTTADVYEFVITGSAEDGYTIYDVKDEGYLYASSSNSNVIGTRGENSDDNSVWTIDFDESAVTISANGTNTRNHIRYNYNNGNDRFSCYAETSSLQDPLYLYVKDEDPVVETYTRFIEGYGEDETVKTGWNLIATPVKIDIAPNTMVSGNYDLFRFNQSAVGSEWENYKNEEHSDFTVLEPGKGYLYAHSETIDLSFTGTPYSGDGEIELTYDADATLAGWNLIGNPFGEAAYIENNYPFYKMNDNGDGLITPGPNDDRRIKLMEGIFVQATAQIDKVTFVRSYDGKRGNSEIALNIIGSNNNVIDRAIVRLNEGYTLEKFTLNEDDTKIYIPQADADYAIVCSNGEGTMPVNFKAKEMGKYTISVETEGININYLHLIDRLTGEDVNLLIDNSYSFIASNNESESRFILSFDENAYNANEAFAFQNGNDVIVNGNGQLQVFDVTGRMVMNTTINGVQTINMPNGVYVFRMIGETVNTQKVVVR